MNSGPLAKNQSEGRRVTALLFFVILAVLPFILRLGIDINANERQAVKSLYANWRYAALQQGLTPASAVVIEGQGEDASYFRLFKTELQRDYKIMEGQDDKAWRVRPFFFEEAFLHARIETWSPGAEKTGVPQVWESKVRIVNNALLLGAYLALLALILGRTMVFSLSLLILGSLLWFSHWNLAALPELFETTFGPVVREMIARVQNRDGAAPDLSRVVFIYAAIWIVAAFAFDRFLRRFAGKARHSVAFVFLHFGCEALLLWASSYFVSWPADAAWWKVYLGSFLYRFILLALFLPSFVSETGGLPRKFLRWHTRTFSAAPVSKLGFISAPLLFFLGLWGWLLAALPVEDSLSVLRLKAFLVSFVVSLIVGSRVLALGIMTLALAWLLPPTTGHWNAAALYAYVADAVVLGSFLSPFKATSFFDWPLIRNRALYVICFFAWLTGVFFASLGVPLVIVWLLFAALTWAFLQIRRDGSASPAPLEL